MMGVEWLRKLPKCELHLHIEGSLEPELMFELAQRNNIKLPYNNVNEVKEAYNFKDLQSFLDLYYAGCNVLIQENDFYDLAFAFLKRSAEDGVVYCELFFDPQTHIHRNVSFETIINGLTRAIDDAYKQFHIRSQLIMCFLRHLSEEDAIKTLDIALKYKDKFIGVGLDSGEKDNPPTKFLNVYKKAKSHGLHLVAHAGEEGGPENVIDSMNQLEVERIDHGVRALEDENCLQLLKKQQTPLTVCPLSNERLQVNQRYFNGDCALRKLLNHELMVTINSDDPSYFGGYLVDNYEAAIKSCQLTPNEVIKIAKNGFESSFLAQNDKEYYMKLIDEFIIANPINKL